MSYQTSNKDLDLVFKNTYQHLNKGGLFLFDFWYSPAVYNIKPEVRIKEFLDEKYKITRVAEPKIDSNNSRVDVKYTFFVESLEDHSIRKFNEIHPMRHFSLNEIILFASKNGFKFFKSGEWLTNNPPSEKTWNAYVILKKI